MEADESYSLDEAKPPSFIVPNTSDGQDASAVGSLKGLAGGFCSYFCNAASFTKSVSRLFVVFSSLGYCRVHESFVEHGKSVCFYQQSYNKKGAILQLRNQILSR